MEAPGDKMATTHAAPTITATRKPAPKPGKNCKPVAVARFGSASVPVYRCDSGGRVRFAISHYRDGKRLRQFFPTLEAAKKEAQLVAQRIQAGMQHVTDLKPHERDNYRPGQIVENGMAAQRAPAFVHQLPHRQNEERRSGGPRSGQLAVDHLQVLRTNSIDILEFPKFIGYSGLCRSIQGAVNFIYTLLEMFITWARKELPPDRQWYRCLVALVGSAARWRPMPQGVNAHPLIVFSGRN
jgi:hypothetical protein